MIFTYWTSSGHNVGAGHTAAPKPASAEGWQKLYPGFTVFTDANVLPLLSLFDPELPDLFDRIRIPACRSDIARLVLLHHFGGLYVDAHVGPGDGFALAQVLDALSDVEVVLFDNALDHKGPHDFQLMNTVIGARKGAAIIKILLMSAIDNLKRHYQKEQSTEGYVAYNIFVLTGAWDMSICLFDRSCKPPRLQEAFKKSVRLVPFLSDQNRYPFYLYAFYGYRAPGQHWSERQHVERLFETAMVGA